MLSSESFVAELLMETVLICFSSVAMGITQLHLHVECPKLNGVLAILSAVGLNHNSNNYM